MPDAMSTAVAIIALLISGFAAWINFSRRKAEVSKADQDELEKRINSVKEDMQKGQDNLYKQQDNLSQKHEVLNDRLRKVENVQISETRVQIMLDSKVQPLEANFKEMKDSIGKLESDIKNFSSDIQRSNEQANKNIMKLVEQVSFLTGTLEARRKDDIRRD